MHIFQNGHCSGIFPTGLNSANSGVALLFNIFLYACLRLDDSKNPALYKAANVYEKLELNEINTK